MGISAFVRKDAFIGLVLASIFIALSIAGLFAPLERWAYDRIRSLDVQPVSDELVMITADSKQTFQSVESLSALLKKLSSAGVSLVAFAEPIVLPPTEQAQFANLMRLSAPVLLPVQVDFKKNQQIALPKVLLDKAVDERQLGGLTSVVAPSITFSSAALNAASEGVGVVAVTRDPDGVVRHAPLLMSYADHSFASLPLLLLSHKLALPWQEIRFDDAQQVLLGKRIVVTDKQWQLYGALTASPMKPIALDEVLADEFDLSELKGKMILVGLDASEGGPYLAELAKVSSSLLSANEIAVPEWGKYAQLGMLIASALFLVLLLPRLNGVESFGLLFVSIAVLLGGYFGLIAAKILWLPLLAPSLLLLCAYLLVCINRAIPKPPVELKSSPAAEAARVRIEAVALQGQGLLNDAWALLRSIPVDDRLLEVLYNLALDFERQGSLDQANAVFAHLAQYDSSYRDVAARTGGATLQSDQTQVLDRSTAELQVSKSVATRSEPVLPDELGRYKVEGLLGKGSMGAVYYGFDPKKERKVALKTMALTQEFDPEELAELKERFFREAQTAGRLRHPHIVSIFSAGESKGLAYIAMELLKGQDLTAYSKKENLLPQSVVLNLVADVADALHYAHQQQVVHRDIKPANLMYDAETNNIKITDFGIARLVDSSKTKTGMVLGTPSFMSPEQLAGKKINGSSDLFSLGVVLYQLLTGQLPFVANSLAQLMFNITHEAPIDIKTVRADVPDEVVFIVNKALAKEIAQRYANGAEMAAALRVCAANVLR